MANLMASCCGEVTCAAVCDATPICGSELSRDIIEYITIGKAILPTKYPGQFWAAWHNNLNKDSTITADIELIITKRTAVSENCGGGSCNTPAGLATSASCADVGTIADDAGCKRSVYTENIIWNFEKILNLYGGIPEQSAVFVDSVLTHYNGFPGSLPCGISQPCNTCTGTLEEAVVFGDPDWIAKENRKLIPRWGNTVTPVFMNDVMTTTYPITAVCDKVDFVSVCDSTATEVSSPVCLDFPIIVMPSQSGNDCYASPQACSADSPQNGADTVLWGLDIVSDSLTARLDGLSFPTNVGMGTWNDFWVVKTTGGRLRLMFNMSTGMTAGTTKSPKDGMSYTKTAILDLGNETYRIDAKVAITCNRWSFASKGCHCHTSQPAENNKPVIQLRVDLPVDGDNLCSNLGLIELNVNAGLEDCYRPFGAVGWDACYAWNLLPNATIFAGDPASIRLIYRYLGVTPVERGHPYWVKWRERYNHTETVNNWYNAGSVTNENYSPIGCPVKRSGAATVLPTTVQFYVPYLQAQKCSTIGANNLCTSIGVGYQRCCTCTVPLDPPQWWPAGCYTFQKNNFYSCSVILCEQFCSGCLTPAGTFSGGAPTPCMDGCGSVSIPYGSNCQYYGACADNVELDYSMRLDVCAAQGYTFCDGVANSGSASYQANIGTYPTWIWKWNPHTELSPSGTYPLYQTDDTTCGENENWRQLSTITIS